MASYRDEVMNDSPTAYWRFGESSGSTAADETTNNHDASYLGDPTLGATGALDNSSDTAVTCDGSGDGASPGDAFDPQTGSFTVEGWINMATLESRPVFHKDSGSDGGWQLQADGGANSGDVRFYIRDVNGTQILDTGGNVIGTGVWHHVVAVYDASTPSMKIYVDAVEEASTTSIESGGVNANSKELGLGCNYDGSSVTESIDATIDEFAVYPSALSATRIEAHYDAAKNITLSGGVVIPAPTLSGSADTIANVSGSVTIPAPTLTGALRGLTPAEAAEGTTVIVDAVIYEVRKVDAELIEVQVVDADWPGPQKVDARL